MALLHNRYEIIHRLSAGGMGEVYEATDTTFGKRVALKRIYFERDEIQRLLADNPAMRQQFIQLFEREARLLANLQHPGLPRVTDYFEDSEDRYLVMDFIAGDDLMKIVKDRRAAFPLDEVLPWAYQLLGIVEYLHNQKPEPVYHRDIKPLNLKLNYEKQIVLLDFGIAKGALGDMTKAATGLTAGYGTAGYAPPEQMLKGTGGYAAQFTDARVDIYAIAATLYHLLTGNVPADAPARLVAMVNNQADPLLPINEVNPQVSEAVSKALQKALTLNREQRYASATEMRNALREAVEAERRIAEQRRREAEEQQRQEFKRLQQDLLRKTEEIERRQHEEEKRREQEAERLQKLEAALKQQEEAERKQQQEGEAEQQRLEEQRRLAEAERLKEAEKQRKASQVFSPYDEALRQKAIRERELAAKAAGSAGAAPAQIPMQPPAIASVQPPHFVATPQPPDVIKPDAGKPNRLPLVAGIVLLLVVIAVVAWIATNKTNNPTNSTDTATNQPANLSPIIKDLEAQMVLIEGGTFQMGSPDNEADRESDEGPQHQVTVSAFAMGKYEVTQAQWKAVAGLPKVKIDLNADPSRFKGDTLPVERVSWEEAKEFCERLSKATGKNYRLPSEAEWEYACRAGTTTPFAFGATITPDIVNYNGNYAYGNAAKGVYREKTVAVGSLGKANNFGLFDMHGNVLEWCEDVYHENYTGAPVDGNVWLTSRSDGKDYRLLRGGSWSFGGRNCRSAYRLGLAAGYRVNHFGFRVVAVVRT